MMPTAAALTQNLQWWMRGNMRPPGVSAADVDSFFRRHWGTLTEQMQAAINAAQAQAAQVDRLGVWREDHRLLREALRQVQASGDRSWAARVARWLQRHARNEEVALTGVWVQSSRVDELVEMMHHIEGEHEALEQRLVWIQSSQARFTEELFDELDHHLREEEVALPHLKMGAFKYEPCGITQADIDGQAADFEARVAALKVLVGEDAAELLRVGQAARRMDTRDIPLNRQAMMKALRAARPDLSAAELGGVVKVLVARDGQPAEPDRGAAPR
jgi:hypothetical protein